MKLGNINDWWLRLESDSFIMIVNKKTNEYKNLYIKDFAKPEHMKFLALMLDDHKNYERNV